MSCEHSRVIVYICRYSPLILKVCTFCQETFYTKNLKIGIWLIKSKIDNILPGTLSDISTFRRLIFVEFVWYGEKMVDCLQFILSQTLIKRISLGYFKHGRLQFIIVFFLLVGHIAMQCCYGMNHFTRLAPYLSALDYSNSPVWNIQLNFFPSLNWIFGL